jgi:hypothetical protein
VCIPSVLVLDRHKGQLLQVVALQLLVEVRADLHLRHRLLDAVHTRLYGQSVHSNQEADCEAHCELQAARVDQHCPALLDALFDIPVGDSEELLYVLFRVVMDVYIAVFEELIPFCVLF